MLSTPDSRDCDYAVAVVRAICGLAGESTYIDDIRTELREKGVIAAVGRHDTTHLFGWLMSILSFQGISDRVAEGYIYKHGNVTWDEIADALAAQPSCPKLAGYWRFDGCRYHKAAATCAEPDRIQTCPLPRHPLRNGRLNQTAYSLFLFIRDAADGDLVRWIDRQLVLSTSAAPALARDALIGPLRNVYGVSDKILSLALSMLLIGVGGRKPRWFEAGIGLIVIDTLVHNFLHRTGILHRFDAAHPYGAGCYHPNGCCDVLRAIAGQIDAREFNPAFPRTFPRFIQSAIWRYCAETGLDTCNGNQIDDTDRCANVYCRLHGRCDRLALKCEMTQKSS